MNTKEKDNEFVSHAYGRFDVALSSGKGSTVWDENGKEYIDFGSGIGVTAFGIADEGKAQLKRSLIKFSTLQTFTTQSPAPTLRCCFVKKRE